MKRNVSAVSLIVATRSSGPPASQPANQPVIEEMTGSVASGTPYIISNDPTYQVSYKILALHISYVCTFRQITFLYIEAGLAKNKHYMHYRGVISLARSYINKNEKI